MSSDTLARMLIGYARVSTVDQALDSQKDDLRAAGCERIFTDLVSGSTIVRPGLDKALNHLRKGDTLVVWRLDRLGRSLNHLLETVGQLQKTGRGFRSLREHIDTTTPGGKRVFHLFGALAEFEREVIRERTLAGLASARTRGRVGGRPRSLNKQQAAMAKAMLKNKSVPLAEVCRTLGVSRSTIYRTLKPAPAIPKLPAPSKPGKKARRT